MSKTSVSALGLAILTVAVGLGTAVEPETPSFDASREKRDEALWRLAGAAPDDLAEAIKGLAGRDGARPIADALIQLSNLLIKANMLIKAGALTGGQSFGTA
jgi:hypothetical protein